MLILAVVGIPSTGLFARYSSTHLTFAFSRIIEGIGTSTLPAILGPFFSPGKSIFLFSPILILAPFGLVRGWTTHKTIFAFIVITTVSLVTAQALFYREMWAGIPVWGLRFMLLTMPMLVILCTPIFDPACTESRRFQRWVVYGLLGVSFLIQLAGAAIMWHVPLLEWFRLGWDPYQPSSVWKLANSPILLHLRAMLKPASYDMAWLRALGNDPLSICIPIITVLLAGGSAACLVWILVGLAWMEPRIQAGDLVILDSYGTPLWDNMMNQWPFSVPWYSLPYGIPGTADVLDDAGDSPSSAFLNLIEAKETVNERLWYIQTSAAPDFDLQRETKYLDQHFSRIQAARFTGSGTIEFRLYLLDR
jgi:hypothetical protein